MSPFRPAIVLPLCASLGLHAVLGWSVLHRQHVGNRTVESIQIVYSQPSPAVKTTAVKNASPAPKKKLRGIPVPREAAKTMQMPAQEPSNLQKVLETKLQQQERLLAKLNDASSARETAPSVAQSRSSAEILADPKKGKIFVGYFTDVKRKIQNTFSGRFAHRYSTRGGVELGFIVNSQGFLEKVAVLPKGTEANERLQELAIQCLRESAPFGPFPPELQSDSSITFSIVLYFEDH